MEAYISILRGINVSGQKSIQMASLKELYEKLLFKQVTTYIQSGNVVFKAPKSGSDRALAKKIEDAISKKYKFEVPVIIRTLAEMEKVISTNPLVKKKDINLERLHVTFLSENPKHENLKIVENIDCPPDQFIIIEKEIYLHCPNGYGISKLSNNFFENKLKVSATTRNWKTVNKLAAMAKEISS
jgi:uncharacterized protein (DUF1697 family)